MGSDRHPSTAFDAEVIIVGAGVTGIHQLHRLREAGFDCLLVEAGSGVGGTWYWNRYPGARFDSESYSYGYFFSPELLQDWDWSEHFAGQAETEAYLNFVADRLDLRPLICPDTPIVAAAFQAGGAVGGAAGGDSHWTLTTGSGELLRARFVISATGVLSVPYWPDVPGRHRFAGEAHHTGEWPAEPVSFAGRRVAVIGTGASAVQLIPMVAGEAASLTVYQRTANWCAPLNNGPITAEEQVQIKATYDEIHQACLSTFAGFVHRASRKRAFDDSKEERWALYEQLYSSRGFAKVFSNYRDLMTNKAANDDFSEYLAEKIRSRVEDPATAEKLVPTDHGFGMRRPPMETSYYEAYNRRNVTLVDLNESPIVTITEQGIETAAGEEPYDVIVWATGFDGFTGALLRMDVTGRDGLSLRRSWAEGPVTYLGMQVPGFPNLFIEGGPHVAAGNFPRATELQVDFVTGLLEHARERGDRWIEASEEAAEEWTGHVAEAASIVLIAETSWFQGANIPGKPRRYMPYAGSLVTLRQRLQVMPDDGYPGFVFTPPAHA